MSPPQRYKQKTHALMGAILLCFFLKVEVLFCVLVNDYPSGLSKTELMPLEFAKVMLYLQLTVSSVV